MAAVASKLSERATVHSMSAECDIGFHIKPVSVFVIFNRMLTLGYYVIIT